MSEGKTAVVLSRNYSTGLAVIRSLGKAGYTVDLVASAYKEGVSKLASSSIYVRDSVEVVSKKVKDFRDNELLDALLAYRGRYEEKPVLFPTDDYTAAVADEHKGLLKEIFVMPEIIGGEDGSLSKAMDKFYQGELAKKAGLLIPSEWYFDLNEPIDIPDDMIYPCFCKPVESITGYKHEMAKCDTEEELASHLNRLRRIFENRTILVQQYLEIDNEIDLSGVCLDQEIIIPAVIEKTQVAQHERGVTLAGRVVDNNLIAEIWDNVIEMMKSFHFFGMFDMEFNVVGDRLYFNEVNLRSGGPNYSYFMSGVNLPKLFADEALGLGHQKSDEEVKTLNKEFIYEKVAYDDYINGYISKEKLDELIERADIKLLFDEEDKGPEEFFMETVKRKKNNRRIRRVKNWAKPKLRGAKRRMLRYPQYRAKNRRNPESEYPRVVVAGRNYSTNLSMARSLGEAGYEVEVINVFQTRPNRLDIMKRLKPDAYSKYVKAYYICVSRRRSRRIFNYLMRIADPDRKMLLIPADDLIANIADDYADELRDRYILPNINNKAGEITRVMSKTVQKEIAREAGLNVVNSRTVEVRGGEYEIPDDVTYPCFVKPDISRFGSKKLMRKCDSREELEETFAGYNLKKNRSFIIEDYVDIKREFSLLGLSTREGVLAPGFFAAVDGGNEEHRGVAISGELIPVSVVRELVDKLTAFTRKLDYEGLFDIDLIETASGEMYFVEINMRFGTSGRAVAMAGVNLPAIYADWVYKGIPIDFSLNDKDLTGTFVNEKVLIEEYAKGRVGRGEIRNILNKVDFTFIKDKDDMKPYYHFVKYYNVARVMKVRNRIRERYEDSEEDNQ